MDLVVEGIPARTGLVSNEGREESERAHQREGFAPSCMIGGPGHMSTALRRPFLSAVDQSYARVERQLRVARKGRQKDVPALLPTIQDPSFWQNPCRQTPSEELDPRNRSLRCHVKRGRVQSCETRSMSACERGGRAGDTDMRDQ